MGWRSSLIDAYYRYIHMDVRPIYRQMMANQYLPKTELLAARDQRLEQILELCRTKVPYYRDRVSQTELNAFPVLTKREIDAHYQELINPQKRSKLNHLASGSGTTRTAVHVLLDRHSLAYAAAARWRSERVHGLPMHPRVAMLSREPYRLTRYEMLKRKLCQRVLDLHMFNSYTQSAQSTARLHRQLKRLKPHILSGFVSSIAAFVHFSRELGLKPLPLRVIRPWGENVTQEYRKMFADWFQAPISAVYGAREVGHCATECEYGNYHQTIEMVHLEVLDDNGNINSQGKGRLLVTPLQNEVMPLVRYDLGDIVTLEDGECPCGRTLPILKEIHGRTTEIIKRPDGALVSGNVFYRILAYLNTVDFRVVQDRLDHLDILVIPTSDWGQQDMQLWEERSTQWLAGKMKIDFSLVDEIPELPSGKRPHVISLLEDDGDPS